MIEPPEVPHAPHGDHGKGPSKWLDKVMAISVLVMSMGSLYVALHTGAAMDKLVANNEKLVKAQSTPMLQYSTGNVDSKDVNRAKLSFSIANVGTGPARLAWVRLRHGDTTHVNFQQWLTSLGDPGESIPPEEPLISSFLDGVVLPVGDERTALSWARPADSDSVARKYWERANKERFQLKVEACFCSVFDECWLSPLDASIPKPVAQCTLPVEQASLKTRAARASPP